MFVNGTERESKRETKRETEKEKERGGWVGQEQ